MRGNSAKEPGGPQFAVEWFGIAGAALLCLLFEYWLGFVLLFSPGWACGWPFGLSFQAVVSGVITGGISIMLCTAAAGAGAIAAFACTLARVGRNRVWQFYRTWLWLATFVILFLSVLVFQRVYASVSNDFPNGYPTEHEPFTPGGLRDKDGRVLGVPGK
jgi:hypothetical protein